MTEPTDEDLKHARVLWDYHRLDDPIVPSDVIIGLGSHDLTVADHAAHLWRLGQAPLILFTGANAPTTRERFPRGEAAHYRDRAIDLGVPGDAILVEPAATNTGENVNFCRELLERSGNKVSSAIVVSRPYQQRRARATFRKQWVELDTLHSSIDLSFVDYLASIGDAEKVINMLVGDTQRIVLYSRRGFAAFEAMPLDVETAFSRLVLAGYVARLAR